jgi:hypothetical protein
MIIEDVHKKLVVQKETGGENLKKVNFSNNLATKLNKRALETNSRAYKDFSVN